MKSKKGQGLSINTLVIIALAVFVIFLVIGFVTSGWGYFTNLFGGTLKHDPVETARTKCNQWCATWQATGTPEVTDNDYWDKRLCDERRDRGIDFDNDGVIDSADGYSCRGGVGAQGSTASAP